MNREYYYKPPEWTKERIRDIFVAFNDDIPITEFNINRFFIDRLETNESVGTKFVDINNDEMVPNTASVYDSKTGKYTLENRMTPASILDRQVDEPNELGEFVETYMDELNIDVIEALLDGITYEGTLSHFVVLGGCGESLHVDEDTLIALPKIMMRIIAK